MLWAYLVRPGFSGDFLAHASVAERDAFLRHGEYLDELHARGVVKLAGRCSDGELGIVILEAASRDEAERLMRHDPSVEEGLQEASLHPFSIFLPEGLPQL